MAGRPGRKPKKSLEEQIEQVSNDIETYKTSIKTLEDKKKELLRQKREEDLSELYKYIQDNDLSVKKAKAIIEEYRYGNKDKSEERKLEVI